MNNIENNNLFIYKNKDGKVIVDAILKDDTLWLSQKGMSKVFECSIDNISLHLKNIFKNEELTEKLVVEESSITASDGKIYKTKLYSLDAIIAVGYRINSKKATEFRIWATKILKEYITKGFALNDERFINGNKYDVKYFDELLERIKIIRVSERARFHPFVHGPDGHATVLGDLPLGGGFVRLGFEEIRNILDGAFLVRRPLALHVRRPA